MGCRPKGQAGFTLIELMVVISIVGILVAIALPTFTGRQGKGFDARVRQDARNAATGQEAYYLDTLSYFAGDCTLLPGVNLSPGVACTTNITGGGGAFQVATSHPRATVSCVFTSDTEPNLNCADIAP